MKPQYCDVLSLETITLHDFDVKLHSTIGFSDSFWSTMNSIRVGNFRFFFTSIRI